MNERLDPEQAQQILRRAAELESRHQREEPGLDRGALEAAAEEVGISPDAVRKAMAEHDAGTLVERPDDRHVLGPAQARVVRTVAMPITAAQLAVSKWLKSQLLTVHSRRGDEVVWTRRTDMVSKVFRRVDVTKRVQLGGVDRIVASVVDRGDGRALIRLDADLEFTRKGLVTGVVAIPAVVAPVVAGAAAMVLSEPWIFAAGIPAGAAMGAAGIYAGRKTLAAERDDAQRILELFVADLDPRR